MLTAAGDSLPAGKSTLLQILAGKRLISAPGTDVRIKDRDVFRATPQGITFLGTEWCVTVSSRIKHPKRMQESASTYGRHKIYVCVVNCGFL